MAKLSLTIILLLSLLAITFYNPSMPENSLAPYPSSVKAQPITSTPVVSIVPGNISDVTKGPASELTFNVTVANSPAINGFIVWVKFDPRVLMANLTSIDYSNNIFPGAIVQSECINDVSVGGCSNSLLDSLGTVNLGMVYLGNKTTSAIASGLLFRLTLTVVDPRSGLLLGPDPGATQIQVVKALLVNGLSNELFQPVTNDGFFTNRYCGSTLCKPPHAEFTFSPSQPSVGTKVFFNASASSASNPGASISGYTWLWGEVNSCKGASSEVQSKTPIVSHVFCEAIRYDVSLTVNDTYGITWSTIRTITVNFLFVDVYIRPLSLTPSTNIAVGTQVNVATTVINNSTISENATLTVSVNNRTITTGQFQDMPPKGSQPFAADWNTTGLSPGLYKIEASLAPIARANITVWTVQDAFVQLLPVPDVPPTASFSFSPSNPVAGQAVIFDGSNSSDPDGTIQSWVWSFGDAEFSTGPTVSHAYNNPGNYTVLLIVQDNGGLLGQTTLVVRVGPRPTHDVSIVSVNAYPIRVVSTGRVSISIQLSNNGLENETVSVTAYFSGHPIQTLTGILVPSCPPSLNGFCFNNVFVDSIWDTSGVLPGNYTISASVFLPAGEVDPTPSDNTMMDGIVTVLPPPILILSPDHGTSGARITVQGNGFLFSRSLWVTFDDMFLGYAFNINNGTFTFTLDVPQAQPGTHTIKALDLYSGARASTTFTITPSQTGNLVVIVNTGSVYFPSDTVVVYVFTTFNGVPTANSQVTVQIVFSNGTSRNLSMTSLATGLYMATYPIPESGPLGTYAIIAKAQMGAQDASTLATFQVKETWLSHNKNGIITTAATLAGVLGLVAVVWKKGYLRRTNSSSRSSASLESPSTRT